MSRAGIWLIAACSSCTTEPWVALGRDTLEFTELEDGDELVVGLDGSGCGPLLAFALPIRAGGFHLTSDMPVLELKLDVENVEGGFDGHFTRVVNYPIAFEALDEGGYEFDSVLLPVPELDDLCVLDEQPARLHGQVDFPEGEVVAIDLEVSIEVPETLGFACTN
jgi:hypothetical protein